MSNDNHPERRPGEIFLMNGTFEDFQLVGYPSKRMGNVAFDRNNQKILLGDLHPIFVSEKEYDENMEYLRSKGFIKPWTLGES